MYQQILGILNQYGYEEIRLNVSDIYLAYKESDGEGYAVVTLDETKGTKLSEAQFRHVSEQIRGYLQQKGCYYHHFLYLLVSDWEGSAGRLFHDYDCFWRIVPKTGRLMVFERLDEVFMALRRPLEEMLADNYGSTADFGGYYSDNRGSTDTVGGKKNEGDFVERLKVAYKEKRLPLCNILLLVVNVLVFLYTDFFAVFSGEEAMNAGALGWYFVMEEGEWYRLFTSMFLHMDGSHLFNNLLVLGYIGSWVERELGSWRYGVLYLGSGLLAGCTSMLYNMVQSDYVVSVGASGAVFGTIGALLYLVLVQKRRKVQYNKRQIAFMAFFSLYGGFASQGVDNAAHIGGFVAGFALAGLLTMHNARAK